MDMDRPLTIFDLPRAEKPGDAGLRFTAAGIWTPIGWNVRYNSPMVQARKKWHDEQAIGGRAPVPGGLLITLATCSRCTILIGKGYVENEVYLSVTGFTKTHDKTTPTWGFVCSRCATYWLDLSFGFCLVAQEDWSGPYRNGLEKMVAIPEPIIQVKVQALNQELIPLWNVHARHALREHLKRTGSLEGYSRLLTFQSFLANLTLQEQPTPLTITAIANALHDLRESA